jgi:hypothetical protein
VLWCLLETRSHKWGRRAISYDCTIYLDALGLSYVTCKATPCAQGCALWSGAFVSILQIPFDTHSSCIIILSSSLFGFLIGDGFFTHPSRLPHRNRKILEA